MSARLRRGAALLLIAFLGLPAGAAPGDDDAARYVQFVQDFATHCQSPQAKQILVRNTHPSRKLRVWLDRYLMGTGTGDRSRSDLAPGAEPEPLGCSSTPTGAQEWRLVRAAFID